MVITERIASRMHFSLGMAVVYYCVIDYGSIHKEAKLVNYYGNINVQRIRSSQDLHFFSKISFLELFLIGNCCAETGIKSFSGYLGLQFYLFDDKRI